MQKSKVVPLGSPGYLSEMVDLAPTLGLSSVGQGQGVLWQLESLGQPLPGQCEPCLDSLSSAHMKDARAASAEAVSHVWRASFHPVPAEETITQGPKAGPRGSQVACQQTQDLET